MSTVTNLQENSKTFFSRHWPKEWGATPTWQLWSPPFPHSVPNYNRRGCYALVVLDQVIYIGLGVRKSSGYLKDHGISLRLLAHVVSPQSDGTHILKEKWAEITSIYTIGFETKAAYLAPSLELYLLEAMLPSGNRSHARYA